MKMLFGSTLEQRVEAKIEQRFIVDDRYRPHNWADDGWYDDRLDRRDHVR
jgi:hypothetical protein